MPVRAVVSKPTGAQKAFLWLYSFMVMNSVHIVVAIRRDFFSPKKSPMTQNCRSPTLLNSHINEEVQKMLIGLAKCKQTRDWW